MIELAVTTDDIYAALAECYDPEIPVSIVDLGLIYDVRIDGPEVKVKMTLTTRACPLHVRIRDDVIRRLGAIGGVIRADVEIVWDPPWNLEMMTEAGRKALGRG